MIRKSTAVPAVARISTETRIVMVNITAAAVPHPKIRISINLHHPLLPVIKAHPRIKIARIGIRIRNAVAAARTKIRSVLLPVLITRAHPRIRTKIRIVIVHHHHRNINIPAAAHPVTNHHPHVIKNPVMMENSLNRNHCHNPHKMTYKRTMATTTWIMRLNMKILAMIMMNLALVSMAAKNLKLKTILKFIIIAKMSKALMFHKQAPVIIPCHSLKLMNHHLR